MSTPDTARPTRPADDPGARAALARLELLVTRRLDGILLGDHRGLVPGSGTESGDAREYQVGDDVRNMDWSVTARTAVPHIRQKIADRELETWIVVDLSPGVDVPGRFGTKRDLVLAAVATIGFLSTGDGHLVGMVLAARGGPKVLPPAGHRDQVRRLLEIVATTPPAENGSGLSDALQAVRTSARRTGLVVVVSDFLDEPRWERPLRTLAPRHEILAVHVADPLDIRLPAVGSAILQDPLTGELMELDVDRELARDYARHTAEHRGTVRGALRRCGAPVLALRTDRDWVRDVITFVGLRRVGGLPTGDDIDRDLPDEHMVTGGDDRARGDDSDRSAVRRRRRLRRKGANSR